MTTETASIKLTVAYTTNESPEIFYDEILVAYEPDLHSYDAALRATVENFDSLVTGIYETLEQYSIVAINGDLCWKAHLDLPAPFDHVTPINTIAACRAAVES